MRAANENYVRYLALQCRLWVKNAILAVVWALPIFTDQQTFSAQVGTSVPGHKQTWRQ
jgi:hypothetical protein